MAVPKYKHYVSILPLNILRHMDYAQESKQTPAPTKVFNPQPPLLLAIYFYPTTSSEKLKGKTMQKEVVIKLHKPDASEMLFFLLCGVIISVPLTLFIYQYTDTLLIGLNTFTAALISRALFAPFIEEFSKAYPLFYRHGETQRSILNLAVLVGLGFGIVELLTYVTVLNVPVIYRLPGLFFHPASTAITAYGIATKQPLPYYLIAVFFHFANNYLSVTLTGTSLELLASTLVVSMTVFLAFQLRNKTKEKIVV